jgi:hypothetical protein
MFTRKPAKRISLESFKARAGDVSVKPSTDIPFPTRNMIGAAAAAVAALSVAFGAPALAGTGSPVNIVDPKTSADVAHVTSDGELEITGGVTTQQAIPANFFHHSSSPFGFPICTTLATPPAGSALIIKQVRLDVLEEGQPGATQDAQFYVGNPAGGICGVTFQIGQVNPPTVGQYVVPFDPGLGIPAGSVLSAQCFGGLQCQAFVDGFVVPANEVPPVTGFTASVAGSSPQNR